MKALLIRRKVWTLTPIAILALALAVSPSEVKAGDHRGHSHFGYRGYSSYRSGPIYHGPSVHYDRVYHPEYSHWTPWRGWHTHGHYDVVPHYTPGHFDYKHGNHIHTNPWFHH